MTKEEWLETPIRCIETGEVYDNIYVAAEKFGLKEYTIKASVTKHTLVGEGYHFVKADEPDFEFGVKDLPGEHWYDIPEWEGLYQFSNKFRVKSLQRTATLANGATRPVPEKLVADTGQYKFYKDGKEYFYTTRLLKAMCPQALERKHLFKLD